MNQDLDIVRIINKPLNWTSFDVCNYLKREYPKKTKIGHAGTLDPLATGVLVIAIGKATKRIDTVQSQVKEYEAEVTFGASTITYDAEAYPDEINQTSELTESIIIEASKNFVGEIDQTPPAFSALKINGKRAYELARAGEVVVMKSRKATVYSIELLNFEQIAGITKISLRISCAKGTYIRSIANDLGVALGCGAFLSKLVRTKIGEYTIENSEPFSKDIN
jgi:tRNA pseudouridine55 synthase